MSLHRQDRKRKARKQFRSSFWESHRVAERPWGEHRGLRIEPLEERRLLAVDTVTSNLDDGSGGTLRSVIAAAQSGDTIEFASGITQIDLTQGQIEINKDLTIQGPTTGSLTLDQTTSGGARIFLIDATDANSDPVSVSMSGMTLTGGDATGSYPGNSGGAIFNLGILSLDAMTLSGNSATLWGGGINNASGTLTLSDSTLSDNTAQQGGAIANGGTVTVIDSTLSGNTAQKGGGIETSGTATVTDSTLSGNSASLQGGGFWNYGTANIANTILAGNTVTGNASTDPDVFGGFATTDHNLIGIVGDATGFTDNNGNAINGNLVGTAASPLDPKLGPLEDNGGLTQTMALLSGSPAIDKGDNSPSSFPPLPATDQRGYSRIVADVGPGFRNSGGTVDIGAFEVQPTVLVANSFFDNNSNVIAVTSSPASGDLVTAMVNPQPGTRSFYRQFGVTAFTSIQAAIDAAGASGDTIEVEPGTYRESLDITSPVILESVAMAGATTVIEAPSTGSGTGITINTNSASSTVIDGFTISSFALGVSVAGGSTATLRDDTLSSNGTSTSSGGGISNQGTLAVTQTTITGNQAANGGGVYNTASLTVTNSTIAGNTAASNGGGIDNAGVLSVNDATLAGNSAGGQAGGIFNSGSANVANTIVATNVAQSSDPDVSGSFAATDHDLIGIVGDATGFTNNGTAINGNQVGTTTALNPQLGPLANNGGPTQTMALLLGSPAIGAGDDAPAYPFTAVPLADQRGFTRVVNGTIDIGAFEVQPTLYVANSFYDQTTGQQTSTPATGDTVNWLASGRFSEVDNLTFGTNAFTSVEAAVSAAPVDAQVDVAAGTYTEAVSLTQAVTLLGANAATTSIVAPTAGSGTGITISATQGVVSVDGVTVSGFATGVSIASGSTAVLSDDTLSNNHLTAGLGGGVSNNGVLSVIDCTITGNSASTGGGIGNNNALLVIDSTVSGNSASSFAGGIANVNWTSTNVQRTATVIDSTISGNTASSEIGGVMNDIGGWLTVSGSTISDNTARFADGGILNDNIMALSDSTISGNTVTSSQGNAGGIFSFQPATLTNCTISGNSAASGGGIVADILATLTNCTISGNTATTNAGGLLAVGDPTPGIKIANTIIAGNHVTGLGATDPDVSGNFTSSLSVTDHDLIGIVGDATGFTDDNGNAINGNLVGTAASPIDPKLGPLQDNGGLTQTMALLPGSPAIDKGDNSPSSFPPTPATDQRGFARVVNGTIDIGAYESNNFYVAKSYYDQTTQATTSTPNVGDKVNWLASGPFAEVDGLTFGTNAFSSIQTAANAVPADATIFIAAGTYNETVEVTQPLQLVGAGAATVIQAPTTGSGTGISAQATTGKAIVDDLTVTGFATGVSVTSGTAVLNNDTITDNGSASSTAGGVLNFANLTITATTVSGNSAVHGGGIESAGTLSVIASSVTGNSARGGAGIDNRGTLVVSDSTIANNSATLGAGGGLLSSAGTASISSSTISGNTAVGNQAGGGIAATGGTVNLANTIIAGNSASGSGATDPDVAGAFGLTDHDLIGILGDASGFTTTGATASIIVGSDGSSATGLGPLESNGGPTQTMALLAGSPAINAGDNAPAPQFALPATDQRGFERIYNNTIDIGAFEVAPLTFAALAAGSYTVALAPATPPNESQVEIKDANGNVLAQSPVDATSSVAITNASGSVIDLTVDYSHGDPLPSGGLKFAGAGSDTLAVSGYNTTTLTNTYTGAQSGSVQVGSGGAISYSGLLPLSESGTAASIVFNLPGGTVGATLQDDGTTGNNISELSSTTGSFETTTFAEPTGSLTVNAGNGGDTINVATGFTTDFNANLNLNGGTANDTFNLQASPAGGTITIDGKGGSNVVNLGSTAPAVGGTLSAVAGPVVVQDTGGSMALTLDDSGDTSPKTILLTTAQVSGFNGSASVSYSGLSQLAIDGGSGGNTVNIQSTNAATAYNINTGSGIDTVNVASDAATDQGNLANIHGNINLDTGGGNDTLNVSDLGGSAGTTYTLSGGNGGPTTLAVSTAGGTISYNAAQSGDLEHFNLTGSAAGGNTYNIPFTSATASNTIIDGSPSGTGGSTFNIQADRLQAGAANNFNGDKNGNTFNLDFAADQSIGTVAGTTLTIGGGTTGSSSSRNVVNLNATADTQPRTLGFNYPAATGGALHVTGLGTDAAGSGIQVSAAQEVNFFGGSADNDTETVTASGNQSVLSVTPTSLSTADVFLNGAPEVDNPVSAANNPGEKGGGTAPDLFLAGIGNSGGKGGLFVNGGGGQLVVNASTEDSGGLASTSGWGGSGLTFANGNAATLAPLFVTSAVRPAGHAYDNITVNGSSVAIANADPAIGSLATVNIAGGFSNPSATEPAVTVNAGDEAGTQANGVADNVNVTLSPTLHFLINGGNPAAASAPNGDQLTVPTPGDAEVWSDAGTPPAVSIASSGEEPVTYTSIERPSLSPGNGVVNVYGDDNQPATSQNDGYQVVGTGPNAFTLAISGNRANAGGYSLPISFSGVHTLNVYGEAKGTTNAHSDVNELDVTPYADNTPQGWGVQTFWNQGNISGGGSLVYNGVAGVSENISLAPSAAEAGQLFSNNAATGTPVAVINYASNTNLVVNGSSNARGNTDTLTLKGTNPGNPGTTGNEQFTVDFATPGTLAGANIIASDAANGSTLLNLQKLTNIGALNVTGGGAAAQNTLTVGGYNPTTGQTGTLDPSLTVAEYPTSSTAGVVSVVENNGSAANQYPEINYSGIGTLTVNTAPTSPVQGPTVSFGSPNVANSGLQGSSDTGVAGQPATLDDRITSNSTPTFYGTAEANSVVRLYVDVNGDGKVEANDVLIGQAVATPAGGDSQNSIGQWSITSTVDLNNPKFGFSHDGLRTILATAQDVLGNVSSPQSLTILLDTQGPQIGNVSVTGSPNYNLFLNEEPTPTPLVNSLNVTFTDPVTRSGGFDFPAVNQALATTVADYQLVGRTNGIIPITSVTFADNTVAGGPGTSVATLHFASPLPDDDYTLTVSDNILDDAGNALTGAFNGSSFPTGNGSQGSSFTGSFVVNSHPHLAVATGGNVALDINGDGTFDPSNTVPDSDVVETFGLPNDQIFSGKFATPATGTSPATVSGFDQLGSYGFVNGQWRWLLNLNPALGASSPTSFAETLSIKGQATPVAGYFAGNPTLGMQVGLFDNGTWYLDVLNHHTIDSADVAAGGELKGDMKGTPIVGDFDGDGKTDLAAYQNGVFEFDLSSKDPGGKLTGNFNATINTAALIPALDYPGVTATPVAADVDGDGITDLGLYVTGAASNGPGNGPGGNNSNSGTGQWYWLVSNDATDAGGANPTTAFASLNHAFNPTPLGHDLSYQYGAASGVPLVGIWDPPTSASASATTSSTTPATGYVPALYANVLGRQPASAEVTYWNDAVANGQVTNSQIAQTFLESSEHLSPIIEGYYEQYLGRAADSAGLSYWIGVWQANGGLEQVQAGIIGSPEYYATASKLYPNLSPDAAWVTALYNNLLSRDPDSQGLAYWTNYIQTNSKQSVVLGFVTSDEYRLGLIDGWFEEYLGRAADPQAEQYWLAQMQQGVTQDQVQAALLASDEFVNRSQTG